MKFTDLKARIPQHVIVAADPKAGKSTLASQLAEDGFKLLWFSIDNGHSVLSKLSPAAQERIEIIVLPDTKDFPIAIDTMKKVLTKAGDHKICDRHGQIDCTVCAKNQLAFTTVNLEKIAYDPDYTWVVVIDNISQLSDSGENYVRKAGKLKDDDKTEWDHYSHWQFLMKSVLSAIQVAPYNIVCLAHLVESEMEDGKKKLVPMVGSSVYSRKVGGYFDHVVFLEIHNMAHKGASSSTFRQSVLTGSRTDVKMEDQGKMSLKPFFDGSIKKDAGRVTVEEVKDMKVSEPVTGMIGPGAGDISSMHSTAPIVSDNAKALELLKKIKS